MSEKKRKPRGKAGGSVPAGPAGPMNVDFLQQLVNLMSTNDLSSVDLRDQDRRIVLKRGAQGTVVTTPFMHAPPTMAGPSAPGTPTATPADEDAGLLPIKSPMVGTFYTASSPDAKPFVSVGSVVDEETDVCIIEAMKVFNNIKAETRGTIARIMVTNGQTVEFGTVLFLVKPN